MKKTGLIVISVFILSACQAQVNEHALGLRFGYGGGISYQYGLNKINRVEADLGFNLGNSYSYFKLTGAYHWVFDVGIGLNIFAGPAITVGSVSFETDFTGKGEEGFFVAVGAQLGVDYNFQGVPLQVSIDILPQIGVVNKFEELYLDPALAIRWVF